MTRVLLKCVSKGKEDDSLFASSTRRALIALWLKRKSGDTEILQMRSTTS